MAMHDANPDHMLRLLSNEKSRKLADKLYDVHIKGEDGDYRRHPEFLLALDRLLSEFGGIPAPPEEEEEETDEEGNPVEELPDDSYADDYDIHEGSVDEMKIAITAALKRVP